MYQPQPSAVVLGRYQLEREIARGGMSSVWSARDLKLQRQVAVKLMAPTWAWSPQLRQRFEREAMAVAQLQSPHIVQVFDYGVEHDCPVIVMELLHGEDLRKRLKKHGRLPLGTVARIVAQTAKGLSEAHAAGVIHRDLKPGNVFFARSRHEEIIKVLDFGVAKADPRSEFKDHATNSGAILGTPQYMSPEQARARENVDYRTDLWSLGVVVYVALTGELPYTGDSATDVLVKICTEPFRRPTEIAPDLPPDVDAFIATALAHDPDYRFRSAHDLAAAFARIAPMASSSLHPPPIEDAPTALLETSQPPGLPDLPSAPSIPSFPTVPSAPSMVSATLGSQFLDPARPPSNPGKQLAIAVVASLLVAGVGVAATIRLQRSANATAAAEGPVEVAPPPASKNEEPAPTLDAKDASSSDGAVSPAPSAVDAAPPLLATAAPRVSATPQGSSRVPAPSAATSKQAATKAKSAPTPSGAPKPDPYGSRF